MHRSHSERLEHGERPVPELRLGCDQLDRYPLLGEIAEREDCLERRDPAAGDEHAGHATVTFSRRTLSSPTVFTPAM